jgi:hypothetical protein
LHEYSLNAPVRTEKALRFSIKAAGAALEGFWQKQQCGLEIATLPSHIRFSHAADGRWRAGKRAVSSVDIMKVALTLR